MTFGQLLTGVSDILPGVGGILSGILGSASSKRQIEAAKEMNGQNIRLARETNAQQMDMFNRSLDFNANQADLSWQRQKEMFDMENLYNSPIELIKRLTEAGINPQIAFNGMTGYAASADGATPSGGASAPSIPSLTPPQAKFMPDYQSFNPFESISKGLSSFATAAKSIAEAKKAGLDNELLETTFDDYAQQMQQETKRMRLENYARSFETEMLSKYGEKIKVQELESLVEDVKNKILQGDNINADTYLKNQQGSLTQLEGQEKEAYVKRVEDFIDNMLNLGVEQIKTEKSKQSLNYEQGKTERQRRSLMLSEEEVNKANKVYTSELTKMSTAERKELIANSIALYEDSTGIHINEAEKARVTRLTIQHMEKVIRQQGADYWNPFKYVGHLLGGSGTYNFTPQGGTRSVVRGFAK